MNAHEFDTAFDAGHDLTQHLDLEAARRPNLEMVNVEVDFPLWMVTQLDQRASRLGVTRQALIKVIVARSLEEGASLP